MADVPGVVNFSNHIMGSTFSQEVFRQGWNYLVEVVDLLQLLQNSFWLRY